MRSTIITFSARSLADARQLVGVRVERRGALDRRGEDLVAGAPQEQLGREARDRALRGVDERGVRGGERLDAGAEQVERVALERRLEPGAQIDLEDVAGPDVLERAGDGRAVLTRATASS